MSIRRKLWSRRRLLGGLGFAGISATGLMIYRAAPRFWQQYVRDWNRPIARSPYFPRPDSWPDTGLHAAWLGHATVLLKIDGFTILTDPVFSDVAGLELGPVRLGIKRLVYPAVSLDHLPTPDLVLLSHAHMDHFDLPSLRGLENKSTSVVTAWETADLLETGAYHQVRQLRWGDRTRVGPATVTAFEVNHWGARYRTDTYRGYNGYLVEVGRHRVMFGGDTADTHLFRPLKASRPVDLAVMPIGAYDPWLHYHCTPEQAWRMGNEAGAEFFIPVHHRTFRLSNEPYDEPIQRFYAAAANHLDRVAIDSIGQEFHL